MSMVKKIPKIGQANNVKGKAKSVKGQARVQQIPKMCQTNPQYEILQRVQVGLDQT